MIYRYSLVTGTSEVSSHQTLAQPTLLQVNRQIRKEALRVYYKENHFTFNIVNYDATLLIRWCQSIRIIRWYSTSYEFTHGRPIWQNMLAWIKASYFSQARSIKNVENHRQHRNVAVLARLFKTATNLRNLGLKWEDVEVQLENEHMMLAEMDQALR